MRVLVVDDHPDVRDVVSRALTRDGHDVVTAVSAAEALSTLACTASDLIVLDLALPDGSGLDVCRQLRRTGVNTPILMLTALRSVEQRVEGLDAGADDFLGKPFAIAELRARVRALGRRGALPKELHVQRGEVALDFLGRRATRRGSEVPLTAKEWAVLDLLASRGGRPVSRSEILEMLWGDADRGGASLEVLIARIRRKLDEALVVTHRGFGYALASA